MTLKQAISRSLYDKVGLYATNDRYATSVLVVCRGSATDLEFKEAADSNTVESLPASPDCLGLHYIPVGSGAKFPRCIYCLDLMKRNKKPKTVA